MAATGVPTDLAVRRAERVDPAWVAAAGSHGGVDPLGVVLGLAGLGSVAVVGLALVALARRRSWSYFLVTAALGTLLARTSLGLLSMAGAVSFGAHHLPEHALDVAMIALLLGAIYASRSGPDAGSLDRGGPDRRAPADAPAPEDPADDAVDATDARHP